MTKPVEFTAHHFLKDGTMLEPGNEKFPMTPAFRQVLGEVIDMIVDYQATKAIREREAATAEETATAKATA